MKRFPTNEILWKHIKDLTDKYEIEQIIENAKEIIVYEKDYIQITSGHIEGYYKVTKASLKRVKDSDYPIRIKFDVADWTFRR